MRRVFLFVHFLGAPQSSAARQSVEKQRVRVCACKKECLYVRTPQDHSFSTGAGAP